MPVLLSQAGLLSKVCSHDPPMVHMDFMHITIGSLTGRNGFGVKVYFIADVTGKPVGYGTWKNSEINNNGMFASGKDCGAYIGSCRFSWFSMIAVTNFHDIMCCRVFTSQ